MMAASVREHDWSATPLGLLEAWPNSLKRAVEVTLGAPIASVLLWGPDHFVAAYNEGYRVVLGDRPDVLGQPVLEVWAEERALLEPQLARVLDGETLLFREVPMALSRGAASDVSWFDYGYGPIRDDEGAVAGVIVSILEVTDRVLVQRVLRDSEERQAFLLKLGDTLRPLADAIKILTVASEALGRHLNVGRCAYCDMDETGDYFIVEHDWTDGVMPSFVGRHFFGFGEQFREDYRAGKSVIIDDALADARAAGGEASFKAAGGVRAAIGIPLIKDGRFVAGFFVQQLEPRRWTAGDEALTREVAERTWAAVERARAETALRESEERVRADLAGMRVIYDLHARLANESDLRLALGEIVGAANEFLDTDRGCIQLVSDDGERLEMFAWRGYDDQSRFVQHFLQEGSKEACDAARRDRRRLLIEDVEKFSGLSGTVDREVALGEGIRATQHTPLASRHGELLGVLSNQFREPHRPLDEHLRLIDLLAWTAADFIERHHAVAALRESEKRLAVLLDLTDAFRPLTDPIEMLGQATTILGEYMQADRTFIAIMDPDAVNLDVYHEYLRPGASSVIGHHNFDQFGAFVSPRLVQGHIMAVEDISTLPLTETERAHYAAVGIAAYLLVPLVRDGRFAACFTCNHQTARRWSEADKNIVRQTADRTWAAMERARAEASLRESEQRFAQFAKASSGGLWIRDAKTLAMEFVSPAIGTIYGVKPDTFLGDIEQWAAMILPEDRHIALEHIESARRGEPVSHEFRIQRRSDQTFRWLRDTSFPLEQNGKVERIGGIVEDMTEAKLSVEHQAVLLAELQHRVRNIMAIIRSIVSRTADSAEDVATYADELSGRLLTLARVQALLTRAANANVSIATIVHAELSALATHAEQFEVRGPEIALSPKAAETMTLAIHELTTNALKYGALSVPDGAVRVEWDIVEKRGAPWIDFRWRESGAPSRPQPSGPPRRGFGSELIEGRIPYELKGRGTVTIGPGGAQCHLEFPLKEGSSILETGAPNPTTVFGGAIDMSGEADLSGRKILVVEDDYYLATDTARALRGAGAEVLGPCPTEAAARNEIADVAPSGAVLDINLEGGRSYDLARELKSAGTPFIFITGYDQDVIPQEFEHIIRLQKPVEFRRIVAALAEALGISASQVR